MPHNGSSMNDDSTYWKLPFWVWVSSQLNADFFTFWVDGNLEAIYTPGQYSGHENGVGYPSSNTNAISIGASNDGGPSGAEERSYYSQFGSELDTKPRSEIKPDLPMGMIWRRDWNLAGNYALSA